MDWLHLIDWQALHLLRPAWLLALPLLIALLILLARRRRGAGNWQGEVDPALLPHLIHQEEVRSRNRAGLLVIALIGLLGILALAGPSWQKLPLPVFRQTDALVIALDLSRSMDASDIAPTRLTRARHKLIDILKRRREGQTALIVYAARAFTVTPLTDDVNTIIAQVPALTTDLMPAQGSDAGQAVKLASQLLQQAGLAQGRLLFISDGLEGTPEQPTDVKLGISLLAVGTSEGAPIRQPGGGFVTGTNGEIVVPRLDPVASRKWIDSSGGFYVSFTNDDRDIDYLQRVLDAQLEAASERQEELQSDQWREEGPWLVLLMLPLAALAFRRGLLVLVLLWGLQSPNPAQADWRSWFLNPDQLGARSLSQGKAESAARQFADPEWRAEAEAASGQYQQAASTLAEIDSARAHYNRGNALARAGQLEDSLKEYEEALRRNPEDEDARYNQDLVKRLLQQQSSDPQPSSDAESQPSPDQQQAGEENSGAGEAPDATGEQGQGEQPPESQPGQDNSGEADPHAGSQEQTSPQGDQTGETESPPRDGASPEQDQAQESEQAREAEQGSGEDATQAQADEAAAEQATDAIDTRTEADDQGSSPEASALDQPSEATSEQDRAVEQWLRRIPDDPSGLLRRKFLYQYRQLEGPSDQPNPW